MSNAVTIEELQVIISANTSEMQGEIDKLKTKIEGMGKTTEDSNSRAQGSFNATAAVAAAAFYKIVQGVNESVQAFKQYESGLLGLQKIAEHTGQSFGELEKGVQDFARKGLNPADIQAAYKNLLAYGMTTQQATKWIEANADAASVNREAHYGLSEAVRVASEGVKQENSRLTDATGVTKNVAKMYQEYAQSIGKTVESLTQADKVQAVMNGTMAEAEAFGGSLAEQMDTYAGAEARLSQATSEMTIAFGESVAAGLQPFLEILTVVTTGATDFIEAIGPAGTILIALALSTTGVVVAKKALASVTAGLIPLEVADTATKGAQSAATFTLAGALTALNAAMGPVGWALVALTAGIAGGAAIIKATTKDIGEMSDKLAGVTESARTLDTLSARFDELSSKESLATEEAAELKSIIEQLDSEYGIYAGSISKTIGLTDQQTGAIKRLIEAKKEQLALDQQQGAEDLKGVVAKTVGKYDKAVQDTKSFSFVDQFGMEIAAEEAEIKRLLAEEKSKLEALQKNREETIQNLMSSGMSAADALKQVDAGFGDAFGTLEREIDRYNKLLLEGPASGDELRAVEMRATEFRTGMAEALNGMFSSLDSDLAGNFGAVFSDILTQALESGNLDEAAVREFLDQDVEAIKGQLASLDLSELSESGKQAFGAAFTEMMSGAINTEGFDEQLSATVEQMRAALSDADFSGAWESFQASQESALQGGIIEMSKFESESAKMLSAINGLTGVSDEFKNSLRGAVESAMQPATEQAKKYSTETIRAEKATKDANKTLEALKKGGKDSAKAMGDLTKEVKDVSGLKSAYNALNENAKGTKEYGDALNYLSKNLGLDTSQIEGDLAFVGGIVNGTEADMVSLFNTIAQGSGVSFSPDPTTGAMIAIGDTADANAQRVANFLNSILAANGASITVADDGAGNMKVSGIVPQKGAYRSGGGGRGGGGGGGGGGGSKGNTRLDNAMTEHDRLVSLDRMTTAEQIKNLEKIRNQYAKTTKEKQDLEVQLYELKKQKQREDLDHSVAMDRMTVDQQIKALNEMLAQYKKGTEERMRLEEELHGLKKEKHQQDIELINRSFEHARDYGAKNEALQIKSLENFKKKYKLTADEIKEIDEQIYQLRLTLYQRQSSELDNLANGVLDALRNKYEQERDAELKRIEESKQSWNDWAKERTEAVKASYDAQIKALDDLTKAEDRAEKDRQDIKKIEALNTQIAHERDEENLYRLREQLRQAEEAREKRLRQESIADQKEALQAERDAELESIKQQNDAQQAGLDQQKETAEKYWDDRLETQKLRAEAEKILVEKNQKEIVSLLKKFNKDYDAIGKSWGEQLMGAFGDQMSKMTDQINAQISAVQKKVREAQAAALEIENSKLTSQSLLGEALKSFNPTVTVYGSNITEQDLYRLLDRINREQAMQL